MRVRFSELFDIDKDGFVVPKHKVTLGGATMNPREVVQRSAMLGRAELASYKGKELDVEKEGDTFVIRGPIE